MFKVLSPVESALIDATESLPYPTPSTVIPAVTRDYPSNIVRSAYWKLISDNVIARASDGRLTVRIHNV